MKDKKNIKKLVAVDFDGTLSKSPDDKVGKTMWLEKTGEEFKYKGWWGRPESLDFDVYDRTYSILQKEMKNDESYVIILTARVEKLRPEFEKLLKKLDVKVDEVKMKRSEKTKGEKIIDMLKDFPNLKEISVYDDREKDLNSYLDINNKLPENIKFKIYKASEGKLTLMETTILRIINEEIERQFIKTTIEPIVVYHGTDQDNMVALAKNVKILSPEEKRLLPSNTGGYHIGLSTSTDLSKARRYSMTLGNKKVLKLVLDAGAKVLYVNTNGDGIDEIFTGDELENFTNNGIDAIIEIDDLAENEVRILNSNKLRTIGFV